MCGNLPMDVLNSTSGCGWRGQIEFYILATTYRLIRFVILKQIRMVKHG